jgi:predicted phosphoribosyltransferase
LLPFKSIDTVVYALPRGGVIIGKEVADSLEAPLDLVIVRKIGHPLNPEYAIAAISENGEFSLNPSEASLIGEEWFQAEVNKQREEAARRRDKYLKDYKRINAKDKTAIIVDDGLATGLSMLAAIREIKKQGPMRIVVAVPVAPPDVAERISKEVDDFVAVYVPVIFLGAIGSYYENFDQVTDEEVVGALEDK